MDYKQKLAEVKVNGNEMYGVSHILEPRLNADEAFRTKFERDEFTWKECQKYIEKKALEARNTGSITKQCLMVSSETVRGWAEAFFEQDELPKPPPPPPMPEKKPSKTKKSPPKQVEMASNFCPEDEDAESQEETATPEPEQEKTEPLDGQMSLYQMMMA